MGCCSSFTKPFKKYVSDPIAKATGLDKAYDFAKNALGGGDQSQTNNQSVSVSNRAVVNIDLEKLTEATQANTNALKNASIWDFFFKVQSAQAQAEAEEQGQATKEAGLKLSAMALNEQIKQNKRVLILTSIGIFLTLLGLIYKSKKGGKK